MSKFCFKMSSCQFLSIHVLNITRWYFLIKYLKPIVLISRLFLFQMLSGCSNMNSISQAKSRLGHAVVMLLQAGALEKFKNVPLTTGLDLACFAGVLIFLSASMFLLSQLHRSPEERTTVEPNPHTV